MSIIKIKRTNEFVNSLRDYQIFIDNINVGTIGNGKTETFEVEPGNHTICAKIDWCSSPVQAFSVNISETTTFKIGVFKGGKWLIPLSITAGSIFLLMFRRWDNQVFLILQGFSILLALSGFLGLVYFLSLGRKKYLTLIHDTYV